MSEAITAIMDDLPDVYFECAGHRVTPEGTLLFFDEQGRLCRAIRAGRWCNVHAKGERADLEQLIDPMKVYAGRVTVFDARGPLGGDMDRCEYPDAVPQIYPDPMLVVQQPGGEQTLYFDWCMLVVEYDERSTVLRLQDDAPQVELADDTETEGEA